jgi:hypothetical protein
MRPFAAARFVRRRLHLGKELQDQAAVDYLGVRFALTAHRYRLHPPWRPVFDDEGGKVWENPNALPLFFLPRRVARAAGEEAIRLALTNPDFRDLAVVTGSPAAPGVQAGQEGEVAAIRARSNGFDMEVRSRTGGRVVSSVSYAPDWRCRIDGRQSAVAEVNSAFLGFSVPPGAHHVSLDYQPAGWRWGLFLCGLGISSLSIPFLWRVFQSARRGSPRSLTGIRQETR